MLRRNIRPKCQTLSYFLVANFKPMKTHIEILENSTSSETEKTNSRTFIAKLKDDCNYYKLPTIIYEIGTKNLTDSYNSVKMRAEALYFSDPVSRIQKAFNKLLRSIVQKNRTDDKIKANLLHMSNMVL